MSNSNANNPTLLVARIGTQAATATVPAFSLPKNFIVTSVKYMDGAGVVADNTNYLQLSLQKGSTVIAALDTRAGHDGTVTAVVALALTLDAGVVTGLVTNGVANEIPAGDYKVIATKNGTGVPTDGSLFVYGYWK